MVKLTQRKRRNQSVRNIFSHRIGEIDGEKLKIYASSERHMLQQPRGWSVQTSILQQAKSANVKSVEIIDKELGVVFTSPLDCFWSDGIFVDRGFGEQLCLPINYWKWIYI
jgi:hypothetical protein